VTLGRYGLGGPSEVGPNLLVNVQASVLLHELGHNLGLLHGGDEARNDKPPYLRVMNYLYTLTGLPASPADEGDRYHFAHALACGPHGAVDRGDPSAPPNGPSVGQGTGAPAGAPSPRPLRAGLVTQWPSEVPERRPARGAGLT